MPYIKKEAREKFALTTKNDLGDQIHIADPEDMARLCKNSGELNYLITSIIHEYLSMEHESYSAYNEVIGVLECAKLELYRRKVSPYEDEKIKENGDV
jgi:broad-specificity NMP kinase